MVGALGQQHLARIDRDGALAQHARNGLAQWQVAPGSAVAMLDVRQPLRARAAQRAAQLGPLHPRRGRAAIAHAHLVVLLQLLTQQRHHVHRFGHVRRGGLGMHAAAGLAHVIARAGPRLHIAARGQAVVGLHHRVAAHTVLGGCIADGPQAGAG
ncbi:hypothetical protein D3C72_1434650 [compost metagenome]